MKVSRLRLRWSLPCLVASALIGVTIEPCLGNAATPEASGDAYGEAYIAQSGKQKKKKGAQPGGTAAETEAESPPAANTVETRSASLVVVVNARGEPIKDAEVRVTVTTGADGQTIKQFTDSSGAARFNLKAPGLARVQVLAVGFASDMDKIELKPGTQNLTFNLQGQE